MNSFRLTLLLAVLMGAAGAASAQEEPAVNELTQALVADRVQVLRDAGATVADDSILSAYEQVANWLAEAEVHAAAEKTYLDALNTAPQLESEIRTRMDSMDYGAPAVDPDSVPGLDKSNIEEKLTGLRVKLRDTIEDKEALDRRIATEQGSAPDIQARFDVIDQRVRELPATSITIDPDIQPSQLEVSQWSVLAERKVLVAERRALEARLSSQPVRYSRRKAESDEFAHDIERMQAGIQLLETELASRDQTADTGSSISIDENAPGYSLVQRLIAENGELRAQSANLGATLAALKEEENEARQKHLSLQERYKAVQQIVSLSENSASLGHVLMVHWHQTDNFRVAGIGSTLAGEIGDHVIRRTEYEDALSRLSKWAELLAEELSVDPDALDSEVEEETLEAVKNLLRSKRELLTELISTETELINVHGSIDRTQQQLGDHFEEYQRYLSSRILWVPSHPPLSISSLKNIRNELRNFADSLPELKMGSLSPIPATLIFLILLSLLFSRRLETSLQDANAKVGRVREDSIRFTFFALLITLVRSIALPLLLIVAAKSSMAADSSATPYLAHAILGSADSLFMILLLRNACGVNGIARVHFDWSEFTCEGYRRLTTVLLIWWWPLFLITALAFRFEIDSINAVFGRLLFCVSITVLCVALLDFLYSRRKILAKKKRLFFGGVIVIIAGTIFFITLAFSGYIYSAAVFYQGFRESLMIALGLVFFYFFMHRWLLVVRRRLRFNDLLAARQSHDENEAHSGEFKGIDLVTLSSSVLQLLKAGTLMLGAVIFAFLWAPLFRALEAMQRVTLWNISDVSDGEAVVTSITLASVALAVIFVTVTFFAARNLPHLIALLLRSRNYVTPGSRYAIVKLLRYLIVGVGVIVILSTLGLRWDRLQWLVAALGVGIGFGLQEIIANFISGLIILFERPIRVGDLVTVGESSGQVIRITIRATTIRDFDGKELLVPNKEFVTGRLLNWTLSNTNIRMTLDVGIAYGSDVRKAVSILEGLLEKHDMILDDPAPDVIFREFGDSALVLTARYFFSDVEQRGYLLSDLHMKINDAFSEAGIVIAFPQIDVHFDRDAPVAPKPA